MFNTTYRYSELARCPRCGRISRFGRWAAVRPAGRLGLGLRFRLWLHGVTHPWRCLDCRPFPPVPPMPILTSLTALDALEYKSDE
jgi:hypothetical protein